MKMIINRQYKSMRLKIIQISIINYYNMKKNVLILLLLGLMVPGLKMQGQEQPASLTLTVQQAVDYALKNNRSIASAKFDYEVSQKSVREAISAGLLQINGSIGLDYNIEPMAFIIVANGVTTMMQVGTKYSLSPGVAASLPLFNAPYYIGVQTAKKASELSKTQMAQTETDIKESVMTTYYLILVSSETIKILVANIKNLEEILNSTKAMYSVGMAESTDVDQMLSNVSTLKNTKLSMERSLDINYNILRLYLGVKPGAEILLTDSLESIIASVNVDDLMKDEFNIENNLNYQLIDGQVKMSELSLKSAKASVLPSLAGSFTYSRNGAWEKFNDAIWYNYSVAGISLNIPIFASGQRHYSIQKAKINLQKAQNTKDLMADNLKMQEMQLRYSLLNSNEQYKSQKENIEIATRVLNSFQNKYKQGMASSLDLTQANNNYLTAENNYLTALMTLLQNKVAFDKLMNNL
jgi:outer membrane protein